MSCKQLKTYVSWFQLVTTNQYEPFHGFYILGKVESRLIQGPPKMDGTLKTGTVHMGAKQKNL